tara:strand:+ start:21 stop:182 length:162 start_codon:yes stop_codon:yes gene_type:complete
MQLVFKNMGYENELEKNYEKLNEWLDECPFEWQEVNHPTSGMTTINITMIKDE